MSTILSALSSTMPPANSVKLCVMCQHFVPKFGGVCALFQRLSLVTGQPKMATAEAARETKNMCGKDGKHFVGDEVTGEYPLIYD